MADDNLTLDAILAASDRLLGFTPDTSEWVRNNPQEVEWAKRSVVMHDKPGDRAELVAIELGAMWVASLIQTDILRSVDSVFDDSIWDAKNTKQMFKDWIGTHPQAVTDARDEINPNVTTYDVAGMTQQLWSQWIDENENYQDIIAIQKEIAAEQATKPLQVETEEEMLARKHVEYAGVVAPKFWQELGVGIQPEEQRTNDTIDLPATQDIPPVPRNYELLLQNVRDELAQGSEQNINQNMLNVLQSLGNVGVTDQDILNWQQRNPQVGLSDATPYEILKVLSKQHDGDTLAIWRTFKPSLREQKYETPAKTEDFKDEDAITEMLNADSQTALSDSENTPQKRQEFREWLQNNPEAVKNSYSNFESGVMDRDLYTRLAVADLRERWIANTRTQEIGAVDMATDTQLLTEEYPYISNEILPGMEDALNEIAWGGQQNATQEQQEFRKWVNNHPNLLPENVDNFDRNAAKDLVLHLHEQWVAQKSGTLAEDGDVAMVTYRVIAMHANIDDTPGRQNDEPVESAVLKTQTEILQELTEQNGGIAPSDPVLLKALIANESALFAHEFDDRFPEFKHLGLNNKAKVNFMYATLPGHEEPQEMTFDDWEESIAALHCVKEDGSTDHIAFANWLEEHPDAAAAVYNGGVDIADAGMALANLWQASESHQARVAVWVKEDADSDEAMWADQSRAAEAKNLRADEPTLPGKESYDDWYSQIMPEVREKAAFRGPEYIAEFETWLNNNEEIARKAYRIGAWGPVYALDKALLPEWNRSRKDAAETDVENGRQDANSQDFLASSDFSEQEIRNWAKNNPQAVDGNATLNEMLQTLGAMYGSGSLAIAVVKECQVSPDDDATIKAREIGNRPFLSMAEERRAQFSKQDGTDALQSTSRYLGKTAVLQAAMDELNAENTVSSIPKPPKTGGNSRKRPCAKNNRRKHEIKETKGDKRAHTPRATKLNQYYLDALTGLAVPIRGDIAVPEGARVIEQPPGRPAPTLFQFHDSSLLPYGSTIITNYGYSTAAADQTLVHRLGRLTGGVIGRQARQTNLDMIGRSADPDAALRVAITEIGRAAGQDNTLTCPFNELTPSEADRDTLLAAIHQGINAGNTAGTRFADPLPATIVPTTELVGPLVNVGSPHDPD